MPPLLYTHGDADDLVLYSWGHATYERLKELGVKGQFISVPRLTHSINTSTALSVRDFIAKTLPDI